MIDAVLGPLADVLALGGASFFLIASIGLLRLPDFYCRVHAPTKAASMGVLLLGLASVADSLRAGDLNWIEDLAILLFLVLTVPVSSQVLAKAARRRGIEAVAETREGAEPPSSRNEEPRSQSAETSGPAGVRGPRQR